MRRQKSVLLAVILTYSPQRALLKCIELLASVEEKKLLEAQIPSLADPTKWSQVKIFHCR